LPWVALTLPFPYSCSSSDSIAPVIMETRASMPSWLKVAWGPAGLRLICMLDWVLGLNRKTWLCSRPSFS